jgi:hypothetical protein
MRAIEFASGQLPSGRVLSPACCCGLETWREWIDFAEGAAQPWWATTGPEPSSASETVSRSQATAQRIELEVQTFRELLAVERDLVGFLVTLRRWVGEIAPAQADAFVAAVDRMLTIHDRSRLDA